jgi:hypothetical protein
MGIAQSRGRSWGRSPLVVFREAERALSEAKHNGRNTVIEYCKDRPDRRHLKKGKFMYARAIADIFSDGHVRRPSRVVQANP